MGIFLDPANRSSSRDSTKTPSSDDESVEEEATMDELKADEEHDAKMHAIGLRLPDPTDEDHLEYSDDSD
ncbi:hypothetical protein LTR22_015233 [Elasticomyces elasticus]|nr:hypothetical protein LTR22_015233 [Elasticomyces elasticus]